MVFIRKKQIDGHVGIRLRTSNNNNCLVCGIPIA